MNEFAKILIGLGVLLILAGILLFAVGKVPGVGRLPGDILIKKENFTFYFPLTTSILISVLLSLFLFFFNRR